MFASLCERLHRYNNNNIHGYTARHCDDDMLRTHNKRMIICEYCVLNDFRGILLFNNLQY